MSTASLATIESSPVTPTPVVARAHPRAGRWTAVGLGSIVLATVALRLEGIGTWYWLDEALSIGIARHPLTEIPRLLLRDGSPPLWYLLLHVWTSALGTSTVATHLLSVVFAVAAVPVAWLVARRLFGARAAWFTAVLASISPFLTYFGRETRMYSLVALLSFVVAGAFVEAFVDERPRAVWTFSVAMLALLYTHNWGLYTLAACGFALIPIWLESDDRARLVRRAAIAFGIVAIGYLPWVPTLQSQVQNTGAPWSYTPSFREVIREVAALFRDERVLAALLPAFVFGMLRMGRRGRSREALATTVLVTLAIVPVLAGWSLSHIEPSWATRYLAVVLGPLLLVAALGLARAGGAGIAALIVAVALITQPITRLGGLPLPRDVKSNGHQVALRMSARLSADDLVIVVQPEGVPLMALELGPGLVFASPMGRVADPLLMDWRGAERRLKASTFTGDVAPLTEGLSVGQRVLVVTPGNPERDTDTAWIKLFRSKGRRLVAALRADRRFAVVDRLHGADRPYVSFDAVLFERVGS